MAIPIHVARVGIMPVNTAGTVVDKSTASVGDMLRGSSEHRVIVDADIPNTAGNPTVKRYLELEASGNFRLQYMDQNTIITYGS